MPVFPRQGTRTSAAAAHPERSLRGNAPEDRPTTRQWAQVWSFAALVGILYTAHSLLRFRNFEAKGYDLGIFDQAVRQYALFRPPIVPIKASDFMLLGDHFHPILALLAPFYWLWPDPRVLNLVMIGLLLATVAPVYLFTRRRLGHVPALLTSGVLLLFWPFQSLVNWDFHEIVLAVPLVAWIIFALDTRRFWWVVFLSIPLLGVREDMGATVLGIGVVLVLKRQWGRGILLSAIGLIGFAVVYGVVMPHLSAAQPNARSYWEYSALGASAGAALVFVLTHPLKTFLHLFDQPLKGLWWLITFVPFGLLSLASPYVIIGAPIVLSRMLSDRLNVWAPVYQYDSVLIPIFLLAFIDTLSKLVKRFGLKRLAIVGPAIPLAVSVIGTLFIPALFPLQRTLTGQNWAMPDHAKALQRAVDSIPSGVCVEATDNAVPHLSNRSYVGLFHVLTPDLASWAVVDTTVSEVGGWDAPTPEQVLAELDERGFTPVTKDDNGVWVLHRDIPVSPVCSSYLPYAQTAPHI